MKKKKWMNEKKFMNLIHTKYKPDETFNDNHDDNEKQFPPILQICFLDDFKCSVES